MEAIWVRYREEQQPHACAAAVAHETQQRARPPLTTHDGDDARVPKQLFHLLGAHLVRGRVRLRLRLRIRVRVRVRVRAKVSVRVRVRLGVGVGVGVRLRLRLRATAKVRLHLLGAHREPEGDRDEAVRVARLGGARGDTGRDMGEI